MIIIGYQWNWWQSHSSWAQAWESYRWERLPRSFSSSKLSSSLSAENWHVIVINIPKIDLLTCLLFKAAKALPLFLMIFKMFMLKKVKVAKGRRFSSTVLNKICRMMMNKVLNKYSRWHGKMQNVWHPMFKVSQKVENEYKMNAQKRQDDRDIPVSSKCVVWCKNKDTTSSWLWSI